MTQHLAERGGGAVAFLPPRGEEAVRERLARSRQRPSAGFHLGGFLLLLRRLRRRAFLSLGVGGDAALRALRRGRRARLLVLRASFLLALQSVALSRAELAEIRGVHLCGGSGGRLRLDLGDVVLADEVVHVDELVDVQVGGLRVLTLDRLRGAVGLDGHAEALAERLLGHLQTLRFAELGVVHAGEVEIANLAGEEGRGALDHADDVELVEGEIDGGVRGGDRGGRERERRLRRSLGGDPGQPRDVRDGGVLHALADAADRLRRGDARLPLLVLQERADLRSDGGFGETEARQSGERDARDGGGNDEIPEGSD